MGCKRDAVKLERRHLTPTVAEKERPAKKKRVGTWDLGGNRLSPGKSF